MGREGAKPRDISLCGDLACCGVSSTALRRPQTTRLRTTGAAGRCSRHREPTGSCVSLTRSISDRWEHRSPALHTWMQPGRSAAPLCLRNGREGQHPTVGGGDRPAARVEGQASLVLPMTRSTRARVFQVAAQPQNLQMPNSQLEIGPEVFVRAHPTPRQRGWAPSSPKRSPGSAHLHPPDDAIAPKRWHHFRVPAEHLHLTQTHVAKAGSERHRYGGRIPGFWMLSQAADESYWIVSPRTAFPVAIDIKKEKPHLYFIKF